MLYEDTGAVLSAITSHFESIFKERFTLHVSADNTFAKYTSDNYKFKVMPSFIQARVSSDFQIPIEDRIDEVLKGVKILPHVEFCFSCKISKGEIPFEYFCSLAEQ